MPICKEDSSRRPGHAYLWSSPLKRAFSADICVATSQDTCQADICNLGDPITAEQHCSKSATPCDTMCLRRAQWLFERTVLSAGPFYRDALKIPSRRRRNALHLSEQKDTIPASWLLSRHSPSDQAPL